MPAAWVAGERKVEHWRTLLGARAIENTVWVIGVGQPGPRYSGHSLVSRPTATSWPRPMRREGIDAVLDRADLDAARRTKPPPGQPPAVTSSVVPSSSDSPRRVLPRQAGCGATALAAEAEAEGAP